MSGFGELINRGHLTEVAYEAATFPETVTIEQIRELGVFAQAVLSRDSAPVEASTRSAEPER